LTGEEPNPNREKLSRDNSFEEEAVVERDDNPGRESRVKKSNPFAGWQFGIEVSAQTTRLQRGRVH
jgi:hypothetical protein